MKKLAVYAEGGTEQAFIEKLLLETASVNGIQITKEQRKFGRRGTVRQRILKEIVGAKEGHSYYALIVDSSNDGRVTSDLREEYAGLVKAGYNAIIAIRDARGQLDGKPVTLDDIHKIRILSRKYVPTKPILPTLILAIMETEAWFIAEHTHFSKIDATLSCADATAVINFDPSVYPHRVEEILQPAENLNSIYMRAGKNYVKNPTDIQRTIDALDFPFIYCQLGSRIPELKPLIDAITEFLA